MKLEDIQVNASVKGVLSNELVNVVNVKWFSSDALELTYKTQDGKVANELLYRHDECRLEIVKTGSPWSFDGDGELFRLVSEAQRIRLAHLFDPVLAVHTSVVEPLPHQITAVYESMLARQPLRFLLADDPGAGKTIMAGLLIKELIARGDLQRCMVVCPGSLAEQWQDELYRRFQLPFEILTNDKLDAARTGNWFQETNLIIARLDKLSRDESVQAKLEAPDCRWDLIVCDEAHKMSATFFGREAKYTKRYRLGELLSGLTRHFLLMTATPHNGKEEDFQLFMALLDGDRFEGRFRQGSHVTDVSDLMRRVVKENLLKFDGTPLFPERIAHTVPYKLSEKEAYLYKVVTDYVSEEFNRAEALENNRRAGTIGFALTILQRRLASSPEAICQSLRRRRERLESRLRESELLQRGHTAFVSRLSGSPWGLRESELRQRGRKADIEIADYELGMGLEDEDIENLEDAPENELEETEQRILDQATAAQSITELKAEIETLKRLEKVAREVRRGGEDAKWLGLAGLLDEIFNESHAAGIRVSNGATKAPRPKPSSRQKLVIFTEHRDTLSYLKERITTFLGHEESVVLIHGGMRREERQKSQEAFRHDPEVRVLLATDAAGEGINLQRAHLMVNYDLPWNPNRLEQRFGRIHRIGQTEVCHLWNLVADETREGDVYRKLLDKLEHARQALGGQVFDVLGKLQFEGRPLRELLLEAIRYGECPEVQARLTSVVDHALDRVKLQGLMEDHALVRDTIDTSKIHRIREDMERAEARRLQPHYIESFFREAFSRLGGSTKQREPHRYEITHVPAPVRDRDRLIGIGEPVLRRYERVAFEKSLIAPHGQTPAAFICPGHPLLNAVIDLTLEKHRDLLKRGVVLVDERDESTKPRILFYLEHAVQDATLTVSGNRRIISKRMFFVELDADGVAGHVNYAPYLDYRPLAEDDPSLDQILKLPECKWAGGNMEDTVQGYAVEEVIPEHLREVREDKLELVDKTRVAVKERLTKEINYWDNRAEALKLEEHAGKTGARLNSGEARKRADELQERLYKRLEKLNLEEQISSLPPVVTGGLLVVPKGLLDSISGKQKMNVAFPKDTQKSAAKARAIIMDVERRLGYYPEDREFDRLGYDIESKVPETGKLRFIEVKGRVEGAKTITVTRNEILYSLNKPEDYILAIVEFLDEQEHRVHYVRQPFQREPDFGVTSSNYSFAELLKRAKEPS